MAITWQNVNGVSLADAMRPLDAAQRSFNGMFEGLQGVIKDREVVDSRNMAVMKQNNTQSYLDQVAALGQTPEALQAAIKSGAIDKLKASFGPNIDHAAVRGAPEALLDQRYKQIKQATDFNNFMVDEKERPIRDQYKAAVMSGNKTLQDQLQQANPNLRNWAELLQTQRNVDHENTVWSEEKKEYVRREGRYDSEQKQAAKQLLVADANIRQSDAQAVAAQAGAEASRAAAENARYNITANREDRQQARIDKQFEMASSTLNKDLAGGNSYAGGTISTAEGSKAISSYIADTFKADPRQQDSLRQATAVIAGKSFTLKGADNKPLTDDNGKEIKIGVPVSVMMDAINASKADGNWLTRGILNNESSRGNTLEKYINDRMINDPKIMEDAMTKYAIHAKSLARFARAANANVKPAVIPRALVRNPLEDDR